MGKEDKDQKNKWSLTAFEREYTVRATIAMLLSFTTITENFNGGPKLNSRRWLD